MIAVLVVGLTVGCAAVSITLFLWGLLDGEKRRG